jgi:hypothetical protein
MTSLITKVLLAGVTLGNHSKQLLANFWHDCAVVCHQDSGSAKLECGSDITVDVGDGAPTGYQCMLLTMSSKV